MCNENKGRLYREFFCFVGRFYLEAEKKLKNSKKESREKSGEGLG